MSKYVLELCTIPQIINIENIKNEVKKYMESRIDFYKKTNRNPYIEDEFAEYWLSEASNGNHIGKGNTAMDIKTYDGDGIDVMCMIMNKNGLSNEKSIIQNFKSSGSKLDMFFANKKDTEAVTLYMNSYIEKMKLAIKNNKLNQLYMIAFISTKKSINMICFKINIDAIINVKSTGFSVKQKNINIDNFINSKYGTVKLYKSKKRVELRIKESIFNELTFITEVYKFT